MVAFTILSLVFFEVMNERVYRLQSEQLYQTAQSLKKSIESKLDDKTDPYPFLTADQQLQLVAQSSHSIIWVVRSDGLVLMSSEIPSGVLAQSQSLPGGLVQIPLGFTGGDSLAATGLVMQNSNFSTLFNADDSLDSQGQWISVLLPLGSAFGRDKVCLQLHQPMGDAYGWSWFLTTGLGLTFLVAFIISIALTLMLMQSLTLPIQALVRAAHQVTLGDLSVRIPVKEEEGGLSSLSNGGYLSPSDELDRLTQTFNSMVARLETVNEEQKDMLRGISHDMKTPLTSIIGFTEAMIDGTVGPDKQVRYLGIIRQEAERLKTLLSDLNQDFLLDSRGTESFVDFPLYPILEETVAALEPQLRAKALKVEVSFEAEVKAEELKVTGEKDQLRRVFYNLLSNACKFCKRGDAIRLGLRHKPGSLVVNCFVEDSGPGIPKDKRRQVFGRFYKLDKSRGNREGSGLGLYICRKILAAHGQQIWASKSNGLGGARFDFTLPAANANPEAEIVPSWVKNKKGESFSKLFLSLKPDEVMEWREGSLKAQKGEQEAKKAKGTVSSSQSKTSLGQSTSAKGEETVAFTGEQEQR